MKYIIGTRGSKLALAQAEFVKNRLAENYPQDRFELQIIKTKGDVITDRPLGEIGGSGLFVKEIEKMLLEGEIHLAVHSMKDMPCVLPKGLVLAPVWNREDSRDVLILREKKSLEELPPGSVIGTGSKRRVCQLKKLRKDLIIVDIRGNVDTRLRKMEELKLDGIVLAAAGLKRLGLKERITQYLEPEYMIPAPTQGTLGIEVAEESRELLTKLAVFQDIQAQASADAERCFLKEMGADCHLPIGAYLKQGKQEEYTFYGIYGNRDGSRMESVRLVGKDPCGLAKEAAALIRRKIAGKVFLVGAGPGDPELLTLRGYYELKNADCVIYDRLASDELLNLAKTSCEKIYVGKENHHHTLPQDQINELLMKKALEYSSVVRLKGGDPYVFGRGGEEALYLRQQGISCEVIPGISSALAGLAYAGIPVTHRGLATGFHVVTAHNRKDQLADIDFSAMANSGDTCIFLMGLSELRNITGGLLQAGKPGETPAAVISHATTAVQRCCTGTLADITEKTEHAGLTSPALIVVGDVVSLRKQLNFFEEKPLSGRRYLVAETLPLQDCFEIKEQKPERSAKDSLSRMLREHGASVDKVITGRISRISVQMNREELGKYDWVVFTSRNAVSCFFENLWESELDIRAAGQAKFACIGGATAKTLSDYGIRADYCAKTSNGTAFGEELRAIISGDSRILYPQNKGDFHSLTEALKDRGELTELPVYENRENTDEEYLSDEQLLQYDGICFTNALSAKRLFAHRPLELLEQLDGKKCIYAIGPVTAGQLQELGISHIWQAAHASYDGLADLICQNHQNGV